MHRKLQKSDLWLSEPFTRGQAWADLIMLANHKAGFVRVRGKRIDVGVGCVARAQKTLADRWKWSRGKVIRFLKEMQKDGQIEQQTGHDINIITICNYSLYQARVTEDGTPDEATDESRNGPQTGHETGHIQECKEGKECKEEKKQIASRKRDVFVPPDWVPSDQWVAYLKSRREKKHPMNTNALDLCIKSIEKCRGEGWPVDQIFDQMIAAGWRSVKADWMGNSHQSIAKNGNGRAETHQERGERMARERDARMAGNITQGVIGEQ